MDNNQGGHQATADKRGIEIMKQMLLPCMSEDLKAVPKLLKESAGQSSCCIFSVPHPLAGGNTEPCQPRVISIGPYHHGNPQLQMLEEHKWRYLRATLHQIHPHGIGLEDLIDVVAPKEEMIRQCYSKSTDSFSGPDLVKMMVLDGCFIIELLLRRERSASDPDDPLLRNSYVFASLVRDLLRLENQVPYFVLEDLMEITSVPKEVLADLALNFFKDVLKIHDSRSARPIDPKAVHLLDLIRLSLIPWDQQSRSSSHTSVRSGSKGFEIIGSASNYRRLGIRLWPTRASSTFLDIKFNSQSQCFKIPTLTVDDTFICILLNMVAFEQCHGQCNKHVTAYAMFMRQLIQTEEDAQLLCHSGVIQDFHGRKKDVARFFREICQDASCDIQGTYLASIQLRDWYTPFRIWKAVLKEVYFSNPEVSISVITLLVTLTGVIQTVYALLQYYQPK
ncbi:UPF0481 protein At3g47200-like [Syzygium oleosum]|uniref:UPF0481 protein At3g47200-like n=1 Tax=Syzygium oleosum TaxID=219896 RepID=UPI0024B8DB63|nr:UPF0481 protein At3g47200-like [Syzygium oleosum]